MADDIAPPPPPQSIFNNVNPNSPAARGASATEVELEILEARRTKLLAKKAAEDAIKAAVTEAIRQLAIDLHTQLCPNDHASLQCTWFESEGADSPVAADWTEVAHQRWLGIAQMGVGLMVAAGWTVAEPTPPPAE